MTRPDDLPELDDELASLLADAKGIEGPRPEVRARLRSRLAASLPPPPPAGGAPEAAPSPPPPWSVPAWVAAATFVVGIGTGLLVAPRSTPPPPTSPPPAPQASETAAAIAPAPPPVAASALPAAPPVASVAVSPAPVATHADVASSDLTRERALLDVARTALGRSDAPSALAACSEHERTFPRGALREEREAIAVQALVVGGLREEARARAARFEKAFPSSILLPAVRAAAGVSP